jgi:Sec-independent protein secretion pathway component TatC
VGITILASFITPGDAITLTIAMIVPLFFLYEFGIVLSAMIYRRRRAREALESSSEPPAGSVEAG